jgi:hypothetical protein
VQTLIGPSQSLKSALMKSNDDTVLARVFDLPFPMAVMSKKQI